MKNVLRYLISALIPIVIVTFLVLLSKELPENEEIEINTHSKTSYEVTTTQNIIHYFSKDTRICGKSGCSNFPLFVIFLFTAAFAFYFIDLEGDDIKRESYARKLKEIIDNGKILSTSIHKNNDIQTSVIYAFIRKKKNLYVLELAEKNIDNIYKSIEFSDFNMLVEHLDNDSLFRLGDFKND